MERSKSTGGEEARSCWVNLGPHTFFNIKVIDDVRVGESDEYIISSFHTCIACGERRAVTNLGELLIDVNYEWKERKNYGTSAQK